MEREGINVIGIYLSRNVLAAAKKKAPDASLVCGGAERIPLADDFVDLIVGRWVLWALPRPGSALDEVVRVLKHHDICDRYLSGGSVSLQEAGDHIDGLISDV